MHFSNNKGTEVDNMSTELRKVSATTLKPLRNDVMISRVRKVFEVAINHFPSEKSKLEGDSDIVKNAVFGPASVKLQVREACASQQK